MSLDVRRTPHLLEWVQQACYFCGNDSSDSAKLQRCGGCRRVSYCGPGTCRATVPPPSMLIRCYVACAKANWKNHKPLCKALGDFGKKPELDESSKAPRLEQPSDDWSRVSKTAEMKGDSKIALLEKSLQRPLTEHERRLIEHEPRCLVWCVV
jgi:hypothetical protein